MTITLVAPPTDVAPPMERDHSNVRASIATKNIVKKYQAASRTRLQLVH